MCSILKSCYWIRSCREVLNKQETYKGFHLEENSKQSKKSCDTSATPESLVDNA